MLYSKLDMVKKKKAEEKRVDRLLKKFERKGPSEVFEDDLGLEESFSEGEYYDWDYYQDGCPAEAS